MRTPTQRPKPKKTQAGSFPVPTAGLISNRNLAIPTERGMPPGAAILRNWFPTPSTVVLRRGMRRWATLPMGDVKSLFTYTLGQNQQFFAATDDGIWNVTTVAEPFSFSIAASDDAIIGAEDTVGLGVDGVKGLQVLGGTTNGDWVVLQFSTIGGTFLVGVNGVDTGFIYDGTDFFPYVAGGVSYVGVDTVPASFLPGITVTGGTSGATGIIVKTKTGRVYLRQITGTFVNAEIVIGVSGGAATINAVAALAVPGVTGLTSDQMSFVWSYKNRVFFIERNTLDAWYLPIDAVGGALTKLPLGGVFNRGGSLLFGQTWSLDSGGDGGLSEQCVFVSTEGEVAAYQGISPDEAASWSKVGVYRVGRPLGKKAWMRAGGDLVIGTSIGFIPLGKAITRDYAALGAIAVSNPIADEWRRAVSERGVENWRVHLWADGGMVLISPPTPDDLSPVVFVANSDNGAWAIFDGWRPTAFETFRGRLFMGSTFGKVQEGWTGGVDEATPYTGHCAPLFNDMGSPGSRKIAKFGRAVLRSAYGVIDRLTARFDFNLSLPVVPNAATIPVGNEWDNAIWDEAIWNAERNSVVQENWQSLGGSGYAPSVILQVTSGSLLPLDTEIVRIDFTWETADFVT